jgi:hypothetical protein
MSFALRKGRGRREDRVRAAPAVSQACCRRISSNDGASMSYAGVERALTETTRTTVGVAVSPHLFRTAIASSAAIHGRTSPHLASVLLHHMDNRVTEKHYNRASSLSAAECLRRVTQGYIKD